MQDFATVKKHIVHSNHTSPSTRAHTVERALDVYASSERAKSNAWFFKTGKGEYGEGDAFLGVTVPDIRKVAKQYRDISLDEVAKLLASPLHEVRLAGLLVLVYQYEVRCRLIVPPTKVAQLNGRRDKLPLVKRGTREIVQFYLKHIDKVNNWDLVDLTAPNILGAYYRANGGEKKLYVLAKSKNLWHRRIAIVATFAFIRVGVFVHTLAIAELLLKDTRDLVHKATGWMLREVGKRDKKTLDTFLRAHASRMPRTCLRYAIERFPENERKQWLTHKNR